MSNDCPCEQGTEAQRLRAIIYIFESVRYRNIYIYIFSNQILLYTQKQNRAWRSVRFIEEEEEEPRRGFCLFRICQSFEKREGRWCESVNTRVVEPATDNKPLSLLPFSASHSYR